MMRRMGYLFVAAAAMCAVTGVSFADQDVYFTQPIADGPTPGNISMLTPAGVGSVVIDGLEYPSAICFDPSANLYFADRWSGTVTKRDTGGTLTDIGNVWDNWPEGGGKRIGWDLDIVADDNGNVYFTQPLALNTDPLVLGNISVMDSVGTISVLVADLEYPSAISLDSSGNLYFADRWSGVLTKRAGDGALSDIGNIWTSPATSASIRWDLDIVAAASGEVYFTVPTAYGAGPDGTDVLGNVSVISPAGAISVVVPDLDNPTGIALDGDGNLYFVERTSGDVTRRTPGGMLTTFGSVWDNWAGGGTRIGWDLDIAVSPLSFGKPGDMDGDGDVDADDIDLFVEGGASEAELIDFIATLVERSDGGVGTYRGDFNLDGYVDGTDLAIFKAGFGMTGLGYAQGNANCDDFINGTDLAIFKATFGLSGTPNVGGNPPPVPEPTTMGLLALGACAILRRRR